MQTSVDGLERRQESSRATQPEHDRRAGQLDRALSGISADTPQVKDATAKIKELADVRTQSMEDVDMILRIYHTGIHSGDLKVGQSAVLDKLLQKVSPPLMMLGVC